MKYGLFGLHRGASAEPETLNRQARRAEEAGFDSLWVGDHIALPAGNRDDPQNPALQARLEALVALSFLAGVTQRVRLAAGVIVLPQRQPVLLAKQLASVDVLSGGRLTIGLGLGYVEPELRAFGVALGDRLPMAEEFLSAMQALWDDPTPHFVGRHVTFTEVLERPRPVQRPHPPLVIGGNSGSALRRAARIGAGWYGWDLDIDEARDAVALLAAAVRHDRPPDLGEIEVSVTPNRDVDIDTARRYADVGVHRLVVQPRTQDPASMDALVEHVGGSLVGRT